MELLNFEGPLDLLLQVVERAHLEVADISLGEVTAQYIGYIERLSNIEPAELEHFVSLASRLLLLKSQALIPASQTEDDGADLAELEAQLARYRDYRRAAGYLSTLLRQQGASSPRLAAHSLPPEKVPLPEGLDLDRLTQLYAEVLNRLPAKPARTGRQAIPLATMISRLEQKAATSPLSFRALIEECQSRHEAVVLFLAALELVKRKVIALVQSSPLGDIEVHYAAA